MNNLVVLFSNLVWSLLLVPVGLLFFGHPKSALRCFVSLSTSWLIVELIKNLFYIPRPYIIFHRPPIGSILLDGSFPSAHTAVAFAVAFSLYPGHPRLSLLSLLIALLVASGRVLSLAHTIPDVFVGILLALVVTHFSRILVDRKYPKSYH